MSMFIYFAPDSEVQISHHEEPLMKFILKTSFMSSERHTDQHYNFLSDLSYLV